MLYNKNMKYQNRFTDDMLDYLKWRGDVAFSDAQPINEIDYLIFARFSYLPFNQIALAPRESVKSFSEKMLAVRRNYFNQPNDRTLVEMIHKSKRFIDLTTTDYIRNNDKEVEKQFGAVTIHLPNDELLISYIGTDATLVGWKEDFNMMFTPTIPSQEQAANYLERIASKYPNKKLRLCGHSKGGNVAVFSALSASTDIQKRIIDVINFDGPGFIPDFVEAKFHRNAEILAKIHQFIPQGSIIGRCLQQENGDRTIVHSRELGLYQHDIYSWEVEGTKFVRAPHTAASSEIFNQTVIDILKTRSLEERKAFVNTVYDIICAADFTSMDQLRSSWYKKLPSLIKNYREVKPEDRDLIISVVKQTISVYSDTKKEILGKQKPAKKVTKTKRNPIKRVRQTR